MLKKMGNNNLVRLQKFMAECGVASRRKSEELIEMGKVKVNGHVAHIGDKINPKKDIVAVRGKKITKEERMYYIMLNKPRGYVTTVSDELGRKTVMDLVDCDARVYPVGRLDKDSEGLLILTNDGSFANALTHPKHNYAKVYRVTVRPSVNDEMLEKMRNGIEIDGRNRDVHNLIGETVDTDEMRTQLTCILVGEIPAAIFIGLRMETDTMIQLLMSVKIGRAHV